MNPFTVALAQMPIVLGDVESNIRAMQHHTAEASRRGADLVVFPELWSTGYALDRRFELASPLGQGAFAKMMESAWVHKIAMAGSALEHRGVAVANCTPLIDSNGAIVDAYRKIHLFRLMQEDVNLAGGEAPVLLDMAWGKTALAICYDLRFPELFRRYALQGAIMAVIPAEWPLERIEHWRILLQARAIENQMYIVAVNTCGTIGGTQFGGHSMVVDPWGKILIEAGEEPALLTIEIDLDRVTTVRSKIPVFADRRPDLY